MRLHKYMAHCGVASRRKCEKIILDGKVSVNGVIVKDAGVTIRPKTDEIKVNGKDIQLQHTKIYIILNKPRGYITSVTDQFGRPTVLKLIGKQQSRIYPVGRLDYDTEGLLLLTNDGDLAFKLTHPKHQIEKEYFVIIKGQPDNKKIEKLRKGIKIDDYITLPARISQKGCKSNNAIYSIVIKEGKNRQVRRMFQAIGHPVLYLCRKRLGNITLGSLKPGHWRYLTQKEVAALKNINV